MSEPRNNPRDAPGNDPRVSDPLIRGFTDAFGIPFTTGNRVEPLVNGDEIFPALFDAVEQAEECVEFLTFVYWTGEVAQRFAKTLADAARRGVTVRVLLDAFGSSSMDSRLTDDMETAGVEVVWFRPLLRLKFWKNDHRTHRKVLVVDKKTAFTGGVGIAEEWTGNAQDPDHWRDTHFRLTGPAVAGLRAAFLGNWVEAGQSMPDDTVPHAEPDFQPATALPDGDTAIQVVRSTASIRWSDAFLLQQLAIRTAQTKLHITTAYFVPHEQTIQLLVDAAQRGIDVHVLMPGPHTDERLCRLAGQDTYRPLLDGGVKLHIYQPTMLHAKTITADGRLALLGSANFNQRSAQKDDEVCLTVVDEHLVAQLDQHFAQDLTRSKSIDLDTWHSRSTLQRVKEKFVRPFRREL